MAKQTKSSLWKRYDWGGTEHGSPQSAVLQLKWGEKGCSLLPIFLGAVTWPGSRFKTKSRKNFFTQHIIVQLNCLTQGNVRCRNSNHFKKGIRSVLKTPPKTIKCDDLSAAACWGTVPQPQAEWSWKSAPGNTTQVLYISPLPQLLLTGKSMHQVPGLICYSHSHPNTFAVTTVSILVRWGPDHSWLELDVCFPDI